jgi:hypothetical protein
MDRRLARIGASVVVVGVMIGGAAVASASGIVGPALYTCGGTARHPGVVKGTIPGDLDISGFCVVNAGPAIVTGRLVVDSGSVFAAVYAHNTKTHKGNSHLTVDGDVLVESGATAFIGCNPESACLDDPNSKHPTLVGTATIKGSIVSTSALGTIVHVTKIGGSVKHSGGGGGLNCNPQGIFKTVTMSPVFSDYEDNTIGGSLSITGMKGCYLGVLRNQIAHSASFKNNKLADKDAIEIGSNVIGGNLACSGNSMVWDTTELSPGSTFPRQVKLNTVRGKRSGDCMTESQRTKGGPTGPNPF